MKLITITALVASLGFASSVFAQAVRAPKPSTTATQPVAPKAQTPGQRASQTDAYLSTLTGKNTTANLDPAVSAQTCNGSSLVEAVVSVLSGSQKTAFRRAAATVNSGSAGIILQACQAGEPITQEESLKNLATMVIFVGNKVQKNEGSASDVNLWAEGLRAAIPGLSQEKSVENVKGLAGSKCQLLKLGV